MLSFCFLVIKSFSRVFPVGEVLGFENLVFSIFEFVHALLENSKFKSTVKKALPELIYYLILYMQIDPPQRVQGAGPGLKRTSPALLGVKAPTEINRGSQV